MEQPSSQPRTKPAVSLECFVCIALLLCFFAGFSSVMGISPFLNTMMNTAYALLTDTVFYLMAIAVVTGAISSVLMEFGVVSLLNKLLSPVMRPLYRLPGASVLGILTTYLSDNPAILTLAGEKGFRRYFKRFQVPALTNLGTSFGMGLIITMFMLGLHTPDGKSLAVPALVGNAAVILGSIVSVRLMLRFTARRIPEDEPSVPPDDDSRVLLEDRRIVRNGSAATRLIHALMDGGKSGVKMGVTIIPGVLVICTLVMMLTYGRPAGGYTGAAYEGVALLPWLGGKLQCVLGPLLGFESPAAIAVPITALGSAGAAIGLVPGMLAGGQITADNIAVFTAMSMCWSGYLSTHIAMMDSLGYPELASKAILSHTIGGLVSGMSAHFLYLLVSTLL